jgi:hypothetical protein
MILFYFGFNENEVMREKHKQIQNQYLHHLKPKLKIKI